MRVSRSLAGALGALAIVASPAAAQDVTFDGRTLLVRGAGDADEASLVLRGARLEVDFGRDGDPEFLVPRSRFDLVRTSDVDTVAFEGARYELSAAGDTVRVTGKLEAELDGAGIVRVTGTPNADTLTVADLSATDTFQVAAALGAGADRATITGSDEDEQISVGPFGVLGPTFVTFEAPELQDRLTVDGAAGDDIVSASIATMGLTLAGGTGDNTLIGGPGDDTLIGGDGFDDVRGGPGRDSAQLGGDFDRFSWRAGDGSDVVDGGDSRDSVFFEGSNAAEAFALKADGRQLRLTRHVDAVTLELKNLEEVDAVAGGGADTFTIGDLRRTPAQLVHVSLASLPITAAGDGAPDVVSVEATPGRDALMLTGAKSTATLTGLAHTVTVSHTEPADTLAIDTLAGKDTLDTSVFDPATIGTVVFD
jgi:Ca2+-binding RTX toxin-like protein